MIKKSFKYIIFIALVMFSSEGFSQSISLDQLRPTVPTSMRETALDGNLQNEGFEVRLYDYQAIDGSRQIRELIFINSLSGLNAANQRFAIPQEDYAEMRLDFLSSQFVTMSSNLSEMIRQRVTHPLLYILDKEVMQITSQGEADRYLRARQLPITDSFFETDLAVDGVSSNSINCPSRWRCRTFNPSGQLFNFNVSDTIALRNNQHVNVNLDVSGGGQSNASLDVHYRYKRRFRIPYKVRVDYTEAKLSYDFNGDIRLTGNASRSIKGLEKQLHRQVVYERVFMVGLIPVLVDAVTYVKVGTGDLNLSAGGTIGLERPLFVNGAFHYLCSDSNCTNLSQSHNNISDTIRARNLSGSVLATASINPYLNVAIRGRLYRNIAAEVGLQPSIAVNLSGYSGNQCGDGNGNGSNELVNSAILRGDFLAGVTWFGRAFSATTPRNYRTIHSTPLIYADFLNPSTSLSPIVRSNVNGGNVALAVELRPCARTALHRNHQNFSVTWSDGQLPSTISRLSGTHHINRTFNRVGQYSVTVRHENGSATTHNIHIQSTGGTSPPPPGAVTPPPPPSPPPTLPTHPNCPLCVIP
ncbi:hypothetical protein [Aliidiomarina maris]|uniref:PKD domain-containing protein n=1 Tax=Aliidiomarina maris TaxID=531312 RepID=A0A327WP17_9GAMM|nr:hypothetical protein [Aliidiomarina maris]RAJ93611.1 hypothetical protein B0I24_11717 [Aliidiomarina maris]